MQGLLYGVKPERWIPPDPENHLLVGLSKVPMRMEELGQPTPQRPGWVMAKTRLTGICGSDAKQVFMDFGDDYTDSALNGLFTLPTVLGHEVVAEVVEVGSGVSRLEVGQRVVLNPWLSCVPRGIDPPCGACRDGDSACAGTSPRVRWPPGSTRARPRMPPVASPNICRPTSRCSSPSPTPSATKWLCWPIRSPSRSTR